MTAIKLDTPFLDGGIRSTNFFNGRIVAREDMQREQDAERVLHERLGRAQGSGIVWGFDVEATALGTSSTTDPTVTVHAGLALNRRGQTVALDRDVNVSLLQPAASTGASLLAGSFGACAPPDNTVYIVGSGVYLLTAAPAQAKQGLAVVSGLGNQAASCNAKEVVDGVQFRLFQVNALSGAELGDEAHLRNVAAYKFFFAAGAGTDAARDPFGTAAAAPALTDPALTDCDVPLALVHWTSLGGLRWVDLWSVRRSLAKAPGSQDWPLLPDPRQDALGEAMVRQLAQQIGELRTANALPARASDIFRWLPAAGILPLGGTPGAVGVATDPFFDGFTTRGPMFIEGARVPAFLRLSTRFPPITVGDRELVWLYLVRENRQPQGGVVPIQPYLMFALGRLPSQVVPRFDVSHWDFANYALDDDLIGT